MLHCFIPPGSLWCFRPSLHVRVTEKFEFKKNLGHKPNKWIRFCYLQLKFYRVVYSIWAYGPNFNKLDNIFLIEDNENVSTYLGWLGISIVIHQKPLNLEAFWSWHIFFPICECTREQCITTFMFHKEFNQTFQNHWVTSGRTQQA